MSKRFVGIVSYELRQATRQSDNTLLHLQTLLPRLISRMQKRPPHQYHQRHPQHYPMRRTRVQVDSADILPLYDENDVATTITTTRMRRGRACRGVDHGDGETDGSSLDRDRFNGGCASIGQGCLFYALFVFFRRLCYYDCSNFVEFCLPFVEVHHADRWFCFWP